MQDGQVYKLGRSWAYREGVRRGAASKQRVKARAALTEARAPLAR